MKEDRVREVKKASDYESCMICTKQIESLKQENARLREQIEEANNIISHVVYDYADSSGLSYEYLDKNNLLK